jgi:hypothetical protein
MGRVVGFGLKDFGWKEEIMRISCPVPPPPDPTQDLGIDSSKKAAHIGNRHSVGNEIGRHKFSSAET